METNISSRIRPEEEISRLLALIGQPARIQILLVIAAQEACVCHIEAVTGMRQASISQHLMALRKAALVTTNRAGRNIFYRLARTETVRLIEQAANLAGVDLTNMERAAQANHPNCNCPKCRPDLPTDETCQPVRRLQAE